MNTTAMIFQSNKIKLVTYFPGWSSWWFCFASPCKYLNICYSWFVEHNNFSKKNNGTPGFCFRFRSSALCSDIRSVYPLPFNIAHGYKKKYDFHKLYKSNQKSHVLFYHGLLVLIHFMLNKWINKPKKCIPVYNGNLYY